MIFADHAFLESMKWKYLLAGRHKTCLFDLGALKRNLTVYIYARAHIHTASKQDNSNSSTSVILLLYVGEMVPVVAAVRRCTLLPLRARVRLAAGCRSVVVTPQMPTDDYWTVFLWHKRLRHPAGTTPLPERKPCIYPHVCQCFVLSFSYIFVRAPSAQLTRKSLNEGSPDTLA